jgi:hypothetical protein
MLFDVDVDCVFTIAGEGAVGVLPVGDGEGAAALPSVDGDKDEAGADAGDEHAGALQGDDCVNVGQGAPLFAGWVVTVLVCVCVPVVPQAVALHGLRDPQADTAQSTGQGGALQGDDCVNVGQGAPLFAGWVVTVLVCVCVPVVPQAVALHGLNAPQADTAQSTGQGGALQGAVSVSDGHADPP